MLCGKIIPDSGKIDFDKKIKVGYLDQYININPNVSINNYLKQAFLGLYEKDEEMNRMFDELSKTDDEIIINRYVRLTTQIREYLESNDFYAIDSKIGRIVSGLGIVQYGLDTLVGRLSGGQKVKVALAKLLLEEPDLLILDEPTSGLDPVARSEILDIFQDFIQNEENSIFVSSHITSDLEHIADYITFINNGEIVISKTRDELLEKYGIVKCSKLEFEKIDKNDYVKFKVNKYEYDVLVEDKIKFKRKYDFQIIDKPTLDEIMLIYIKGEK